ncbi:MAG: winged helix-turn-helix transcriptional regulator [Nitrospinae bacterium]|nr:winged helix-turn-helix transcriptional regulator [Nitrospinota bacterium]
MARGKEPKENAETARQAMVGLSKLGMVLKSQAWKEAGRGGIAPTQGQILARLRAEPAGNLNLTEVAEALGVTPATASEAVNTLAEKKLVHKTRLREDRRVKVIALTAKGRREADKAAAWPDFLMEAVGELSPEESAVFLRGLVKMIRALQERKQIPVGRMCLTCKYFKPNVYADPDRPHHCAFVDAPFGDRLLRLECPDHAMASPVQCETAWESFLAQKAGF